MEDNNIKFTGHSGFSDGCSHLGRWGRRKFPTGPGETSESDDQDRMMLPCKGAIGEPQNQHVHVSSVGCLATHTEAKQSRDNSVPPKRVPPSAYIAEKPCKSSELCLYSIEHQPYSEAMHSSLQQHQNSLYRSNNLFTSFHCKSSPLSAGVKRLHSYISELS